MRKLITFQDLPMRAQKLISKRQQSYIDEFTFFWQSPRFIEAWYAGELLAVFDGRGWLSDLGKN